MPVLISTMFIIGVLLVVAVLLAISIRLINSVIADIPFELSEREYFVWIKILLSGASLVIIVIVIHLATTIF